MYDRLPINMEKIYTVATDIGDKIRKEARTGLSALVLGTGLAFGLSACDVKGQGPHVTYDYPDDYNKGGNGGRDGGPQGSGPSGPTGGNPSGPSGPGPGPSAD